MGGIGMFGGGGMALAGTPTILVATAGVGIATAGAYVGTLGMGSMGQAVEALQNALAKGTGGGSGPPIRGEAGLYGSKKHGVGWKEGPALAKARGAPVGQFGSVADVDFAVELGRKLGPGGEGIYNLPPGSSSIVHMPNGTTVSATRVFVMVRESGVVHAYPMP
jgi:hypothetical protein